MFPNSKQLRFSQEVQALTPVSGLIKATTITVNIERTSNSSFLYCDIKEHLTTNIIECKFNSKFQTNLEVIEEFMGEYDYYCFGNDHTFLLNKDGDIIYYDNLTKDTIFMEKQHPSQFHPLQIHNIGEAFITCGGNVKKSEGQSQKIIKVWKPLDEEELQMKCRIVTGHAKPIENSIQLSRNKIITLSTDLTIRSINLSNEQVQSIIPVSMNYYSGCQVDWNSAILGGIGPNISVFDLRSKKLIKSKKLPFTVTQISAFNRINSHNYLLANVNSLQLLDIRTMSTEKLGQYEGERISSIKVLSLDTLILGNHDKSMQIWKSI